MSTASTLLLQLKLSYTQTSHSWGFGGMCQSTFPIECKRTRYDNDSDAQHSQCVRPIAEYDKAQQQRPEQAGIAERCDKAGFADPHSHYAEQVAADDK